jgi:hypothetical protein
MVNVVRLWELIRQNPGIRTLQLCDKMDCSIDELEPLLAEEAVKGTVITAHDVMAPNGRKAKAYTAKGVPLPEPMPAMADIPSTQPESLSDVDKAIAFIRAQPERMASGAQLHVALEMQGTEAPSARLAEAIADGRLVKEGKWWTVGSGEPAAKEEAPAIREIAAPVASAGNFPVVKPAAAVAKPSASTPSVRKTKADVAIEYLKEKGPSSSNDLRALLGIRTTQSPRPYVFNALMEGRIRQEGNRWWVPGFEQVRPGAAPTTPGPVPGRQPEVQTTILDNDPSFEKVSQPRVQEQLREIIDQANGMLAKSIFACAIWSDGTLEMRRGDQTIVRLTQTEVQAMSEFLGKVVV